jgi:ArsR family transcriptional regulator
LAELFKVLSDPTRVRIISALSAGELCVCDVAAALGMSQSAISHQLRVLRQLRLVKRRKAGRMAFYTIDDEHVSTLFRGGMDHVQHG